LQGYSAQRLTWTQRRYSSGEGGAVAAPLTHLARIFSSEADTDPEEIQLWRGRSGGGSPDTSRKDIQLRS